MLPYDLMNDMEFSPGFRLSHFDAIVIMCFASLGLMIFQDNRIPGVIIWFVAGNFFLFCNVFRVARRLELIWAAIFLALTACSTRFGVPDWPITFGVSLAVTIIVIGASLRSPSYHGILWQKINPQLREWWSSQSDQTGTNA